MAKSNTPILVQSPQTGQITELDPRTVSQMPLAQYYAMAGNFVNTQNVCLYDTAVILAGMAVTSAQKQALFTKGKSEDTVQFNTGVAIAEKGEFLTNMINNGEIEGGSTFLLEEIGVDVFLTSELATTVGSRGEIVAPNYVASTVISAANNFKAYVEQIELQYLRNEEIKLRGPLRFFNCPHGASGAFGSPNAGFIQNSFAQNVLGRLSRIPVLQSEDRFSFVLQPTVATWTPTIGANIKVCLYGKMIKQFVP